MLKRTLAVKYLPTDSLKPFARNSRTHSEAQIDQIAASIREFGFTQPILIDGRNGIVAGHGRLLAAVSLGLAEVPTIELKGLSAAQKRAYVIADNKLALNAGWDEGVLADELRALGAEGFDLALTGFDDVELVSFLSGNDGLTDPEEAPEVPVNPVTRLGDLWVLGEHRVLCGDSTVADDVQTSLGGATPHLMVTDPPYGVEYDANWRNEAERPNGQPYGATALGKVSNDKCLDWSAAWRLFDGDVAYVWHADRHASAVQASLETAGFAIRSQVIWAKTRLIISRGDYHWQHEPCWYAVRKTAKGHWSGDRSQTTLWTIEHPKSETGHSTQKPIECMKRPMENNSQPGDAVYDPFLGSGTTVIAGEMIGRKVIGIELSPAYVDVTVERWQAFTGREATLEGDGRTFAEIAASERQKAA